MAGSSFPAHELRVLFDAALRQYWARPGEYLEGVIVGLMRALVMEPDRSWCDDAGQDRNAGHTSAAQRVRNYLNGTKAAMDWAAGTTAQSPLPHVPGHIKPPSQPSSSDI